MKNLVEIMLATAFVLLMAHVVVTAFERVENPESNLSGEVTRGIKSKDCVEKAFKGAIGDGCL